MEHPPTYTPTQLAGLILGVVAGGALVLGAPWFGGPLEPVAYRLLGVVLMVGIFWITEALPLGASALIPAAAFPLLNILPAKQTAASYMSPLILLLMCGFFLALAVERSGVHRRLALQVLRRVGGSPRRLVLGFAVAAAAMSMWISNTATALVMMPLALALADRASAAEVPPAQARAFAVAILLATGYGASVGGMGTPVGTPPNLIALEALQGSGVALTFLGWVSLSTPAVLLLVPIIGFALTRVYPKVPEHLPFGADEVLRDEIAALGPWRRSERWSLGVFATAAALWVTRPDLSLGDGWVVQGWASRLGLAGTHDGAVAALMAVVAFALPSGDGNGERLLPWSAAARVPWGLVLLFGAGIAISDGFAATGVSEWAGGQIAGVADDTLAPLVIGVTTATTFFTEIMSNTALANILMPILASTAARANVDPVALVWPATLACSCAFMLPSATGPNAIVFGTGKIHIVEMVRAGLLVNTLAIVVLVGLAMVYFPALRS